MEIGVQFKRLQHGVDLALPTYAHTGDSGMDLRSAIDEVLVPFDTKIIPCGFSVAIPEGYEAQIRTRSGLAATHGIVVVNSPGTVDSGFRGEIKVILSNQGGFTFEIERGMKIAQMVFAPVARAELIVVNELTDTLRGEGGFGSTGIT